VDAGAHSEFLPGLTGLFGGLNQAKAMKKWFFPFAQALP
jgi:hypothetical protein